MTVENLESERIVVRRLQPADLDAVIALDAKITGRSWAEYLRLKLQQNLAETGIKVSLAAELDGCFAGFLLARVYYGEFGLPEPAAVLDTFGVHPDFQHQGIGSALLRQLRTDLAGLGVGRLQTEVSWDDPELLVFFQHQGFRPADRLCLDLVIATGGWDRAASGRHHRQGHAMELTKTARYGLLAALEMAAASPDRRVTAGAVAGRHGIPEAVVAKVMSRLVHAGLAISSRGVGGGYRLAAEPSELTVLDVVNVFEPARPPAVGSRAGSRSALARVPARRLEQLLGRVDLQSRGACSAVTLAALVANGQTSSAGPSGPSR